jgi:peptidoglycan/xylan/chitin deacetylase (PgdA/CDA1 family)
MMRYPVKTPWWLREIAYRKLTWRMPPEAEPSVYLTFDDGPHPKATPFVLDELAKHNAKATFFCIGKNVAEHPYIYARILDEGHTVANHTNNHLNGWRTNTEDYLNNIRTAAGRIDSKLFRPPYGKIKMAQATVLMQAGWKICMWDVLSADFDLSATPEQCLGNVMRHVQPRSIVLFHDSEKAWPRMSYALPRFLKYCKEQNWKLKAIS